MRQAEFNNAFNFYSNAFNPLNNTQHHNEYAQRTEKQKVRPTPGLTRHYVVYSNANKIYAYIPFIILIKIVL